MTQSSEILRRSAFAQETDEVWMVLLTLSHPSLAQAIRVVDNTVPIVSRGAEFQDFPFGLDPPGEHEDAPGMARLWIDNVSREIGQTIRSIQTPVQALIEVVRAADADTVERAWPDFWLRNVRWNAGRVTGDLTLEDFTTEPYPAGTFTPASFPALF